MDESLRAIFPPTKAKLQADIETLTFATHLYMTKILEGLVKMYFHANNIDTKDYTITDMTGCIGSDTIRFAQYFGKVNSIELSLDRYDMLVNNIAAYPIKVNTYNDDSAQLIKTLKQDIIYMDPPWGGADYKKHKTLRLTLGAYPIERVVNDAFDTGKIFMFILKLPKNYDIDFLRSSILDNRISVNIHYMKKILFVFLILPKGRI